MKKFVFRWCVPVILLVITATSCGTPRQPVGGQNATQAQVEEYAQTAMTLYRIEGSGQEAPIITGLRVFKLTEDLTVFSFQNQDGVKAVFDNNRKTLGVHPPQGEAVSYEVADALWPKCQCPPMLILKRDGNSYALR